jgi:hypothetical protein
METKLVSTTLGCRNLRGILITLPGCAIVLFARNLISPKLSYAAIECNSRMQLIRDVLVVLPSWPIRLRI